MIKPDETYGSFVYKKDKLQKQLVYYRLGQTGWILVSEIPLNELSNDVLSLQKIVFLMFSISLMAILLITPVWIRKLMQPLNELSKAMKAVSGGGLGMTVSKMPKNELGIVIRQFNKMSSSILNLVEENKSIEEEKRRLEIETLQSQINPHFLYNTLNTIKWMAMMMNAENIVGSLTALGNLLRPIFANNSINCTIGEEIEYVENYIKIMNFRFGEGVKVTFDIPELLLPCQILRFTLQPIVENAFSHGMKKQNYIGVIKISGYDQGEQILLEVADNGEGISKEVLDQIKDSLLHLNPEMHKNSGSMSIGLSNVNRRIKLHFGESYGISIDSNMNDGTKVSIKLPKVQKS
jgi:Predicted signal transduction protein with a C-terminal ATPase domain